MIEVLKPGLQSSLQDGGRYGYRSYGVPWSGPMDNYSAGFARELVHNDASTTLLEFYQKGPKLKFDKATIIAVTGFNFELLIDGESHPLFIANQVKKGQVVEIKSKAATNFGYLAIAGGIDAEQRLGSSSYCMGITDQLRLQKGQELKFYDSDLSLSKLNARLKPDPDLFSTTSLKVMKGPEFELLPPEQQKILMEQRHKLSRSISRMGYRFRANSKLGLEGILTGPVQAGTVQLTPSGELIVLMRDAQTTGGYSRVLQLLPEEISVLAQQLPGTALTFTLFE